MFIDLCSARITTAARGQSKAGRLRIAGFWPPAAVAACPRDPGSGRYAAKGCEVVPGPRSHSPGPAAVNSVEREREQFRNTGTWPVTWETGQCGGTIGLEARIRDAGRASSATASRNAE